VDPEDQNLLSYFGIPIFTNSSTPRFKNVNINLKYVLFNQGTTDRSGTRFRPHAIRIASRNYWIYVHSDECAYDLEQKSTILRCKYHRL
jgi:arginase family enzyme